MLAADQVTRRPTRRRVALVSLAVAMVVLAGHAQQAYYSLLLGAIAAAFPLVGLRLRRHRWSGAIGSAAALGAGLALGTVLCGLQLLATLELERQSIRSGGLPLVSAGSSSLPLRNLLGNVLPDYTSDHPVEYSVSVGSAALFLIALALVRWRRPIVWVWTAIAVLAVMVALGPPGRVYDAFYLAMPGFGLFRVPARMLLFAAVAAPLLAGEGVLTAHQLGVAWRRGRRAAVLRRLESAAAVAALAPALLLASTRLGGAAHGWSTAFVQHVKPANVGLLCAFELFAGALVVAGVTWHRRAIGLLPVVVLADLLLLAANTYPMNPLPTSLSDASRPVPALVRPSADHRYLSLVGPNVPLADLPAAPSGLSQNDQQRYRDFASLLAGLPPNLAMEFGGYDADGYDGGVLPTGAYVSFRAPVLPPGSDNRPDYTLPLLTDRVWDPSWLAAAAVTTVITDDRSNPNPPGCTCLRPVARSGSLVAWQPLSAVSSRAHLEDGTPARVTEDTGDRVVVALPAGGSGRLILADTYYPGWTASVDGHPVPVQRYAGYLRAVDVPPGARQVVFEYRPAWLVTGVALSLGGVLFALVLLAWPRRRQVER